MRYDVLMFVALLSGLAASGVNALRPPQSDGEIRRHAQQPIVIEPKLVTERLAVLETNYEHLSEAVKELREELKEETRAIKDLLRDQNDATEKWILLILGALVAGDRGLAIFQRVKNNKKETKS